MPPRSSVLLLALTVLVAVTGFTTWLVSRRAPTAQAVGPATTFSAEPYGVRGFFDALGELGIGARRYRQRTTGLPRVIDTTRRQLLAVLQPARFAPSESRALLAAGERVDLLLAGSGAMPFMQCFGYRIGGVTRDSMLDADLPPTLVELARRDSIQVVVPGQPLQADAPWVARTLRRHFERLTVDSSRASDAGRFSCSVPPLAAVDTLLLTTDGVPVALRVRRDGGGPAITLVADEGLFRNTRMRRTAAGPFVLGLAAGHDEVIFEEYHHGFRQDGSARDAVFAWSRGSPWGWAAWQIALAGLLALLTGAVRFGPVRARIERHRRSPLEHVRALATALSGARGADQAIGAIVRGFRRRLAPGGRHRGDPAEWLDGLRAQATAPRQAALLQDLQTLMIPGQPADSVRRAALTVEELWRELRP